MSEEKMMLVILGVGLMVLLFAGGIATAAAIVAIVFSLFLGIDFKKAGNWQLHFKIRR